MKKFNYMMVALMAMMFVVSNSAMAQNDTKSEISFSVGGYTPNQTTLAEGIGEGLGKAMATMMTFGLYDASKTAKDEKTSPAYTVQYLYRVSPNLKIGGAVTYQHTSYTLSVKNKDTGAYDDVAKNRNNYFTVMPTVKASWFDKKNISLYSKVAAGVCIAFKDSKVKSGVSDEDAKTLLKEVETKKGTRFGYQVSPIGCEFGSKNIRAFVELGYGFQGLGLAGLSIQF
jgi:outer membrane receptor protein involved in Fe transport